MAQVIKTVDVDVPVSTAYNQWTQFESFPKFLDEVVSIIRASKNAVEARERLMERFGLTAGDIVRAAKRAVGRKQAAISAGK